MKKIFLYLSLALVTTISCREDQVEIAKEASIETQNSYDDQAAQLYLQTHSFDARGNIVAYVATDIAAVKLADLNPITLPSGVIYIIKPGAQPTPGEQISTFDLLKIMHKSITYVASDIDGKVDYYGEATFRNTIDGSGVPESDPNYYYVKKADLEKPNLPDFAKERKYYEIEGFQEAIKKFSAYNITDDSDYNLQGIIIVPSRAAFARDAHATYINGLSFRNRSFIFNFQIYKATHFTEPR
ncbi:hypothetical protein [Chryseobacterium sp. MP_3.2]|uniref:hypothetical protein n=1 Tax=Chryseobacterium sp. MP_3.2 TaxID=3071712 RepID=UPI002E07A44F|nr:hypothetical protein [Chryseobacterium sp. MP_3.2]